MHDTFQCFLTFYNEVHQKILEKQVKWYGVGGIMFSSSFLPPFLPSSLPSFIPSLSFSLSSKESKPFKQKVTVGIG